MNMTLLASHPLRAVVKLAQPHPREIKLSVFELIPVVREEADLVEGEGLFGVHCGAPTYLR